MDEFKEFAKISRLNREVIVTEKIDGTNGLVAVGDDGEVKAGSRSRWITPADDNHGFAKWVHEHTDELRGLGPGFHFGEWWGQGIQRRYDLTEKRWSLFNVGRWGDVQLVACPKCKLSDVAGTAKCVRCNSDLPPPKPPRPACCHVVPVLARGLDIRSATEEGLGILRANGSCAAPGFMKAEGVVIFHSASGTLFKVTLEKDAAPKSAGA